MYKPSAFTEDIRPLISSEQIARRVRDMAAQISEDFSGKRLFAVCSLQQGFVFMADLIRELEVPVACQFIRPDFSERNGTVEIFFSPEPKVRDADVLLVEAVIDSGITTEFLVRTLLGLGANSVRIAALLDRPSGRRISLHPDYVGFRVEEDYVVGYGLGSNELGRNLPYLAIVAGAARAQRV